MVTSLLEELSSFLQESLVPGTELCHQHLPLHRVAGENKQWGHFALLCPLCTLKHFPKGVTTKSVASQV